jgi:hypothetical protein
MSNQNTHSEPDLLPFTEIRSRIVNFLAYRTRGPQGCGALSEQDRDGKTWRMDHLSSNFFSSREQRVLYIMKKKKKKYKIKWSKVPF